MFRSYFGCNSVSEILKFNIGKIFTRTQSSISDGSYGPGYEVGNYFYSLPENVGKAAIS